MGYKIVIPVIAIVCVLASSYAVPVLADSITNHTHHDDVLNNDDRAILLKFSGNAGSIGYMRDNLEGAVDPVNKLEWFMHFNEGDHHDSAWNQFHYPEPNDDSKFPGKGISYAGDSINADCNPCEWTDAKNDALAYISANPQKKIILAGFSFGGGSATFLAEDLQHLRQVEGVLLSDPVGPGIAGGSRAAIAQQCDYGFPIDSACLASEKPFRDMNGNIKVIFASWQNADASTPPDGMTYNFNGWRSHVAGPFADASFSKSHTEMGDAFLQPNIIAHMVANHNKKPTISVTSGTVYDVFEGESFEVETLSTDPSAFAEVRGDMRLFPRLDSLKNGVEPYSLIENGSFELGTVFGNWNQANGQFVTLGVGKTNLAPWEITSGTVDHVYRHWIAPDGSKSLDMSGGPPNALGAISQTFQTIPEVTNYRVNFDVSANPSCSERIMGLNVAAGDTPLEHFIVSNAGKTRPMMNWEHKSYLFTSDGPTATLNFASTDTSGCGVTLDNVVVTKASSQETGTVIKADSIEKQDTFLINTNGADGPSSHTRTTWVEDNGWPCDSCSEVPDSVDGGAKGKWNSADFTMNIINAPPTIEQLESIMAGFEAILFLETSDPSILDEQAGFDYTIDWGDGVIENVHDPNTHLQISHKYTSLGKYTITVFATDKDGDDSVEETVTVHTPFVRLLDLIQQLKDDEILNKGNANSFTSKVNSIIGSLDKQNYNPVCNVANALINEIKQGFEKPGKLPIAISADLIEKIKEEKDTVGCNGGVIDVIKQTIPDGETDQFDFTGDVSGTIGDGEKIRLGNLTSGTYSTIETVSSGQTLANIFCVADDYTEDLPTQTVTINLGENEYAVCVFFNLIDEEIASSFAGKRFGSASSDTDISGIRLHSSNGNPSSPQTSDDLTDDKKGSGGDEHLTRPTFGVSHETFETIVDSGFRFNDQSFTINDNHHTPFAQQTVNIGEVNTFEAKIYADKRLKVQEFLFGIPNVGEAHLAELGVEVWYDYNGEIEEVKAVQKSNVIDKETIVATHETTKCQAFDIEQKCDTTNVSMVFLEPLKDKVMAVKAIDYKGRYQITYLNEGVDIAGESLNPMQTYLIPSNVRDQGLIKVTQLEKYSPHWQSDDGRMFEMNSFGSFKEINKSFERFQDTGTAYTRLHSGFGGVMAYELKRATSIFDASELIKELPDYVPYIAPIISERMTDEMDAKMIEQEEIAKKILEESKVQARW